MMDEILGYPTEFQPKRVRMALTPQQFELYSRSVRNSQQQGFEVDALDAKQVRELVPLAGDTAYAGHLYHFGGHANPHRAVQAYAWALADRGGRLRQHVAVTGFTTAGCHVTGVQTDRGTFSCDHVLIAAGPQTGRLAGQLGVTIPLRTARAEMIVTEPLPMMPIGGVDGAGLYGRQTLRGNLAYGGGPHEWVETEEMPTPNRPSTPLAGHIAHRVVRLFPKAAHAKVIRSWAGIIENTPDGRPILDQPEPWQNLTVATMSGVGFGLSPATGRALMQLITQRFCDFADLSTLRLERFADLEPNWDELQGWLPAKVAAA
jgi:sarcosine oxidase subunit beta